MNVVEVGKDITISCMKCNTNYDYQPKSVTWAEGTKEDTSLIGMIKDTGSSKKKLLKKKSNNAIPKDLGL